MKIYENANDQHVRKVVIYEVSAGLAFDKAGTELLTKEQIVDAFLKGCVVENEGNYKTPTGVNVTDSGAELVFGGGSGGAMVVTFEAEGANFDCDKTATEVRTAMAQGIPVLGILNDNDGEATVGLGPCLVDVMSASIGFVQWINEGELEFFIESLEGSDDWSLVGT